MGLNFWKKTLLVAVIFSVLIVLLLVVFGVSLAVNYCNNIVGTSINYNEWVPQTADKIVPVLYDSVLCFDECKLDLNNDKKFNGVLEEIVCVSGDRVYFVYSTSSSNGSSLYVWHIASVDTFGGEFREHYSSDFVSGSSNLAEDDYCRLSGVSDYENKNGGLYLDNCIYLTDGKKTVSYNIMTNAVNESAKIKDRQYVWLIDNHKSITFTDIQSQKKHQVTLQKMAENNEYAKCLLNLSDKSTWGNVSPVDELFDSVRTIGDDIYIITSVLNFHGEATAVVFKYNFSQDEVLYTSSSRVSDRVESNYYFVPYI